MVRIRSRSNTGEIRVIEADKLIRAPGFSIEPNEPLPLSSTRVNRGKSCTPKVCDDGGEEVVGLRCCANLLGVSMAPTERRCAGGSRSGRASAS